MKNQFFMCTICQGKRFHPISRESCDCGDGTIQGECSYLRNKLMLLEAKLEMQISENKTLMKKLKEMEKDLRERLRECALISD